MKTKVQVITERTLDFDVENNVEMLQVCADTSEAIHNVTKHQPNIIFIDYEIEKENTSILIKSLFAESPDSKIILLGNDLSDEFVVKCLFLGAFGYLEWGDRARFFNKLVAVVIKGEAWFSRKIVGLALKNIHG